jgi:hypothetical protein
MAVVFGEGQRPRRAAWLPPDVVEVTGHHFELIGAAADRTADAIDGWVREATGELQSEPR